jgi:hypothetical protein
MGNVLLLGLKVPLALQSATGLSLIPSLLVLLTVSIFLSIITYILGRLLFKSKNQPPLVFSWFPLIGSTLEYGADPFRFYFKYREKVCLSRLPFESWSIKTGRFNTVIASRSSLLGKSKQFALGLTATTSFSMATWPKLAPPIFIGTSRLPPSANMSVTMPLLRN